MFKKLKNSNLLKKSLTFFKSKKIQEKEQFIDDLLNLDNEIDKPKILTNSDLQLLGLYNKNLTYYLASNNYAIKLYMQPVTDQREETDIFSPEKILNNTSLKNQLEKWKTKALGLADVLMDLKKEITTLKNENKQLKEELAKHAKNQEVDFNSSQVEEKIKARDRNKQ